MLGAKIQEHRQGKKLTQLQLGQMIGVGQSTIAMYERGEIAPTARRLPLLAQALGVDVGELFALPESHRQIP